MAYIDWWGLLLNNLSFLAPWILLGVVAYLYYYFKEQRVKREQHAQDEQQELEARIKRLEDELQKRKET